VQAGAAGLLAAHVRSSRRYSSAAVAMGHNALTRAIRHAEARDLIGRNVALLVETPKGQAGRPSKSLAGLPYGFSYTAHRQDELQGRLADLPAEIIWAGRRFQIETRSHTKMRVSPGAITCPAPRSP
jgi:hypothetical protein